MSIKKECEALEKIRGRCKARGWKFTPLERIDGVNETTETLDTLKNSLVYLVGVPHEDEISELLEDLEDAYRGMLQKWAHHRTIFDCIKKSSPYLRWPEGTFSKEIRLEVKYRFHELMTTSRFSLDAVPSISALSNLNPPNKKVTLGHIASLVAMGCILEAIDALELLEAWWREDSEAARAGAPFDWLLKHDRNRLKMIIFEVLATPKGIGECNQQIKIAIGSLKQANVWISYLSAIDYTEKENKSSTRINASKRATALAKRPRRGTDLTDEILRLSFKNNSSNTQIQIIEGGLAEKYGVSTRTIQRRRKKLLH